MSKLEKLCAGIVAFATVCWVLADRHHSHVALASFEAEVAAVEQALREGTPKAEEQRDALLETLRDTRRRWVQDALLDLETRLKPQGALPVDSAATQ